MSDFAFFRFKSANMLTPDEERDKDEIISLTEQVLDSRGIECDARIAKVSEDVLREILEEVRKIRRKRKNKNVVSDDGSSNEEFTDNESEQYDKKEATYVR
jgi:hypothetical protein